jgi:hypothetical protein
MYTVYRKELIVNEENYDKYDIKSDQQWCKLEDVQANASELYEARNKLWDYKEMEESLKMLIGGKFIDKDGGEWVIDAVRAPICGDYVMFEKSPQMPMQCTNGSYPAIIYKPCNK